MLDAVSGRTNKTEVFSLGERVNPKTKRNIYDGWRVDPRVERNTEFSFRLFL